MLNNRRLANRSAFQNAFLYGALGLGAVLAGRAVSRRLRAYDFRNRVVVVTGGSRGLGLVIARQLADEGARLAICARDEKELARAADELRDRGARLMTHRCDLRQPEQIRQFLDAVRRELGPVDVLINNAGIIQVGPLETMTIEDYQAAMEIHYWAAVHAIEQVVPEMRSRGGGRIVNISSIGGEVAVPHLVPYCASKFALSGYSQGLHAELARDNIRVTTICPGMLRTGSPRHGLFKGRHREEYAWFSIGASLPLFSMSAERAARQTIDACRYGRAHRTLSLAAKGAVLANALAPELTSCLLAAQARLLPSAGGVGQWHRKGHDSQSNWSPSWLTALSEQAAQRNNEMLEPSRREGREVRK